MSTFDDYLTHDDKPYAENINDALLLSNVFDLTVPIELPLMFKNGYFNTSTSPRKAGVSIITYVSKSSDNVSVTNTGISGTGDIIFKFYPNFNSYGTISSLDWTATGTVTVDIEGADGEDILTGHTGGTITGATTGLTELQEFTLTLHLTSASISTINFVMANKDEDRYGAEVGISDVTGLQTSLDGKSDIGHTHVADDITNLKTALLDLIYPVGSIYMSLQSTSPNTLFGGQWSALEGRFLIGVDGTNYTVDGIGGETRHTLTNNEMPVHNHSHNHTHTLASGTGKQVVTSSIALESAATKRMATENANGVYYIQNGSSQASMSRISSTDSASDGATTSGGGQSHNNMPPYRAVYMWKRTA